MAKVLILSSEKTGSGHLASAKAIKKNLEKHGVESEIFDCFPTMGKMGVSMENAYIPFTTKTPYLWKISHTFSEFFPDALHWFIYNNCKKKMTEKIMEYKPDLIISDHCMFTKAISKILRKNKLNIPYMIVVIDLVTPPRIWFDSNADILFVPTEKVKERYKRRGYFRKGVKDEQIVVSGFPIREDIIVRSTPKKVEDKINVLMVNANVNLKKNIIFAREIAKLSNVNLKIVCGYDDRLYKALLKEKENNKVLENVEILSYVSNMNELLAEAHVLMTKAGPNMILEGTKSGTAVIVTGHIPGQEAKNYTYITEHGYGLKCENPKKIAKVLEDFIDSGNLQKALENTLKSEFNDGAKIITDTVLKFLKK